MWEVFPLPGKGKKTSSVTLIISFLKTEIKINIRSTFSSIPSHVFSIYPRLQPSPLSNSRTSSSVLKGTPHPFAVTFLFPTTSQNHLIHFLSLRICPVWNYSVNGIIQQVAFRVWLISLSIMFLRLIYGFGVSFWGNENVLELDKGDGSTTS